MSLAPRLALCGNVFPAQSADAVLAAVQGPVRQWSLALQQRGASPPFGLGFSASASAVCSFLQQPQQLAALQKALAAAQVEVWTANAFPFGDFHAERVKEKAFLPDWRTPERLQFTLQMAELLLRLAPPQAQPLSLSTCPLGYGKAAREDAQTRVHLQRVVDGFQALTQSHGQDLVLAIEPEPDGALERVTSLVDWLGQHFPASSLDMLGVCWDLCHSAVVGEETADVLDAFRQSGVVCGKVQISSALTAHGPLTTEQSQLLAQLTEDPYLHQVRAVDQQGCAWAWADLPDFLAAEERLQMRQWQLHCHVPVAAKRFVYELQATAWQPAVAACLEQGLTDFELETYTLPVLPSALLHAQGVVGTMVEESLACRQALALDTPHG